MPTTSDDPENENCGRVRKKTTMFIYIREFIFVFALAFTSYATLFNSLPKVGKPPPAIPFFPANSVVADYYRGTMSGAFDQATRADVSVVMFYAPWDAQSQATRPVFETVARFFRDQVFFAAISCWSPSSECKHHYPKIRSFPAIVAYSQQGAGIQYKGPLVASHIIRFVRTIIRPIHRVQSALDLVNLFSTYDAVVVGSFLFEGNLGGRGYYTFYSSALKALERDFSNEIAFAVTTTSEDAAALQVYELPSIKLFLWNETHEFPLDAEYTEDSVASWLWQKTRFVTRWLNPPGSKATTLLPHLSTGPSLIVFSPRHSILPVSPIYSLVKEISLRYYNCDNASNPWVANLANRLESFNQGLQSRFQRLELKCSRMRQERRRETNRFASTVITASVWTNKSNCDVCEVAGKLLGPQLEVCVRPLPRPVANATSTNFKYATSMIKPEDDELGAVFLKSYEEEQDCQFHESSHGLQKIFHPKLSSELSKNITGLACRNNKTLSIVMLDSMLHYQLAEGLGVDLFGRIDKTVAVIVDPQVESHFLLNDTVSQASLVQFIQDHTEGKLDRHKRSTEDSEARSLTRGRYSISTAEDCSNSQTEVCVPELHSANFEETVMEPSKAVIVFYHSPFCSLCRSVAHVFLLIARYFRSFPGIKFVRIDGENNDLPWRYTMDTYPALLFFPASDKAESRVFSDNLPFTVRNLMQFVLANLNPEAKIPAMVSLCTSFEPFQTSDEARSCKSKIQVQVADSLSGTLKKMRSVLGRWYSATPETAVARALHRQKTQLMHSLQFFRSAGFLLGSVDRASVALSDILQLHLKFLRTSEVCVA